jgi:hypothetical protein
MQDFRNCETILSFDLAFITAAVQEQTLDVLIQIKRMLSGLSARSRRASRSIGLDAERSGSPPRETSLG